MGKKMGASLTSISRWLWSGKKKQEAALDEPPASATVSSPLLKGNVMDLNSKGGDMKIDREYDAVLVPLSSYGNDAVSECDELDWSIGWLESFSPGFQSDDENDSSYAVLVPCYRPGCIGGSKGLNTMPGNLIKGVSCDYSADKFLQINEGRKCMEQWLSSLQGR